MELEKDKYFILSYILLLLLLVAIPAVIADGADDNLTTTVTVGNDPPTVGEVTCNSSSFTPIAESTILLNCTATVSDPNGYQDLGGIRAEFYNDTRGDDANHTIHYYNDTCLFTQNGTTSTNSTVECLFTIYYHANPADWTMYFNVTDGDGESGNNTETITIQSLTALNVTNTTIPFGDVGLGEESAQITTTIKITGNVNLDLNINESLYGSNMSCDGVGSANITTNAATTGVRYNTTDSFTFDDTTWKLSSGNDLADVNWSKSNEVSSTVPPEYNLYWKIKIPASGVSGTCTTTTRIAATES
ncbi:MAG: hypothetical protein KAH93_02105 [Candidatus Aenigmarchaeota archaeon]|nr:hypothetical protein [Candidatus Aenigmarchaeota archaeon]